MCCSEVGESPIGQLMEDVRETSRSSVGKAFCDLYKIYDARLIH